MCVDFSLGAAQDNDLSVELSLWRALGVLVVFRILSDWSGSNACIDSMDWRVLDRCDQRNQIAA